MLLFYVHGKQLTVMSEKSVNIAALFLGMLRSPKQLTSTSCTYFRQQVITALLKPAEGETTVFGRTGHRARDLSDLCLLLTRICYLEYIASMMAQKSF